MKLTILIIVFVVMFLFMADTTVTLKPFKIEFRSLLYALGYMMAMAGFLMVYSAGINKGKEKEHKLIMEAIRELEDGKTE